MNTESWTSSKLHQFDQAWLASTEEAKAQTRQDRRYQQLLGLLGSQVQVLEALDPEGGDAAVSEQILQIERLRRRLSL